MLLPLLHPNRMEGEVLILPTQPIEIFEEGHLRELGFYLSETVKFGVDFE